VPPSGTSRSKVLVVHKRGTKPTGMRNDPNVVYRHNPMETYRHNYEVARWVLEQLGVKA